MNTQDRIKAYGGRKLTSAQRRRMIKKAGTDPTAVVIRDDGMGYPPGMQGYRELVDIIKPVSGVPTPNGVAVRDEASEREEPPGQEPM